MSDAAGELPAGTSAGRLLREARQGQGLHIAALAASIKVSPRKLEALEADRFDELPDATFTRALAQTVCRTLKIDASPVLALLPPPRGQRLEQVSEGINAPFRDRPGRMPSADASLLLSPAVWAPVLILLAAALIYFLPTGWLSWPRMASLAASAASLASAPLTRDAPAEPAASAAQAVAAAAPANDAPASAAGSAVPAADSVRAAPLVSSDGASAPEGQSGPAGLLLLRTSAESWIEVQDSRGRALISRIVQPGETLGLDGAVPLKVKIGNASATQLAFRGQMLDLAAYTRDNVARLELK